MEPWDGPAGIVLTDGRYACCTLDRNGLRPARWVITRNRHITIASEAGVWDYAPEDVVDKGKLGPGEMLALDLKTSELMNTRRIDDLLKSRHPYKVWLKKGVRYLQTDLIDPRLAAEPFDREVLAQYQKMFNVSAEERDEIIRVLAEDESEAVGSMGDDTPMPVLSKKVRSLYDYFRQQFAQVTNPPIDSLRESIVMSLQTQIGPEANIFVPAPKHAEQIVLSSPILSQRKLRQIVALAEAGVPTPLKVAMQVTNTQDQLRYAQALQASVAEGGFDLRIVPVEYSTLLDVEIRGTFELLQLGWSGRIDPDGNTTRFLGTQASANYGGYSSPELDDLLAQASRSTDTARRAELYGRATQVLQRDNPIVYTFRLRNLTVHSTRLTGIEVYSDGVVRLAGAAFLRDQEG